MNNVNVCRDFFFVGILSPHAPLKVNLHGLKIHVYNR